MNVSLPILVLASGLALGAAGAFADDGAARASVSVSDSPRLKSMFLTAPTPLAEGQETSVVIILTGPLSRLDRDTDGQISRDESAGHAGLRQHFKTLDTDRNGYLSAPEHAVFNVAPASAQK